MPATPYEVNRDPLTVGALQRYVATFEASAKQAVGVLASRAAAWLALEAEARKLGVPLAQALGADLYARNQAANKAIVLIAGSLAMLDNGRGELVPYQVGNDPALRFAIVPARSVQLGIWPWVPAVLRFAVPAAVAAIGAWITDAVLTLKQTEADTANAQQATLQKLAQLAQGLPSNQQGAVVQALANVQAAMASPPPGWLDQLAASVRNVSEGVANVASAGSSPLLLLALLWFLSDRKEGARA